MEIDTVSCNHSRRIERWVEDEDWHEQHSAMGHWEYETVSTTNPSVKLLQNNHSLK